MLTIPPAFLMLCTLHTGQQGSKPKARVASQGRLTGTIHADNIADHDVIIVKGRVDNAGNRKFKVTDITVNKERRVVNGDNGFSDKIELRQNIRKSGKRLNGNTDVTRSI